jgi:tRNA(Arg) A34 adenosine deaminase TadA
MMGEAISQARKGMKKGQTPFGAVIAKDGKIISKAHNTVWMDTDITAHAEINAIRKACKKLGRVSLEDCEMYSTTEPCPMCFSAIHWAGIKTIHYGAGIEDARKAGFNELPISNKTMKKEGRTNTKLKKEKTKECRKLFEEFKGKAY